MPRGLGCFMETIYKVVCKKMRDRMKHIVAAIAYCVLGGILSLCALLLLQGTGGLQALRTINDNYAAVLGTVFSLFLIVITAVYVVLTYLQAKSTQESVRINREFLAQAERQLTHSRVPMLVAEMTKAKGGAYFGDKRRQLRIDWKLRNIGDGPSVQIHTRMKLRYTHAEFDDYDEIFEHSFVGNLAPAEESMAEMHFETTKIEKMVEDFEIKYSKNSTRIKFNPRQAPFKGPHLEFEALYSNVHGQYFKTFCVFPLLCLRVDTRTGTDKEKMVYWFDDKPLQDDEEFELVPMNPIFSTFNFHAVTQVEGDAFIERYRNLI